MSKLIPLTKGQVAIVDDDMYDFLSQWNWYCMTARTKMYAVRTLEHIRMHRVVMGVDTRIDHIDGNGLNNQRSNLRLCTSGQNSHNMQNVKGGTSQYKGVCWNRQSTKWDAQITVNYKTHKLGLFEREIDAAQAYDAAAIHYFGEFACINFPEKRETYSFQERTFIRTSQYRGVSLPKGQVHYRADIEIQGKHISLGTHASEIEAAQAYDNAARQYRGAKARLNFPSEE